ncbi:MAG: hypothetical protein Q8S18_11660 [Bacteroidales bacterium]|nr:hypothetical protein [Bacteroidales bacterium]
MKKLIMLSMMFVASQVLLAQPPDPPGDPAAGGDPIGGGAPVGTGIGILLTLGAAYGTKKVYTTWKKNQEEIED